LEKREEEDEKAEMEKGRRTWNEKGREGEERRQKTREGKGYRKEAIRYKQSAYVKQK